MDLQAEKLKLIEWLKSLTDQSLIEQLKLFKDTISPNKDWWEALSDSERASIDKGISDIENGRTISNTEVFKRYGKTS